MNTLIMAKSRSHCPIASTLDLVGDKWSLILVRDMITGKKKFSEFIDSPEGIPTNILTNRLKQMEQLGLIKKQQYQDRPKRYEYVLTEHGRALLPVLQEISRWANSNIADTWVPPAWFMAKTAEAGPQS
ncbi:MAG: helix-turn-helix transcriptional regulator [Fimbriimonadaceae bacterium]|nr:helix-turn-helix transcriptional regulator [Alphaproteobacteria bacterium]